MLCTRAHKLSVVSSVVRAVHHVLGPHRAMSTMSAAAVDINTSPAAGQLVSHNGKQYTTVKEGLAYILIPADASKTPQTTPKGENQPQSVFYNPIQQFNRDLSVLAIKAFGEESLERRAEKPSRNAKKARKRKREAVDGERVDGPEKLPKLVQDVDIASGVGPPIESINEPERAIVAAVDVMTEEGRQEGLSNIEAQMNDVEYENSAQQPNDVVGGDTPAVPPEQPNGIKSSTPQFTILDALSATGLRALRYVHEIPFTTSVTANDLLLTATESIKLNVEHNRVSEKVKAITGNALAHMYNVGIEQTDAKGRAKCARNYDVIDLDPYGTAAPFLDAAVQAVRDDGGLLCVTCTDAGVWASNGYPEKAYSLYGGVPIKGMHSHEGGLRLILHAIATSAARHGLAMEPLLSLSIDFYARVFVKIKRSPADTKFLAGKTMVVYNCDTGCGAWVPQLLAKNKVAKNKSGNGTFYKHVFAQGPSTNELCIHCGKKTHMAGPMYAGPLHSPAFIQRILDDLPNVSKDTYQTTDRIEGMLSMALEETLEPLEEKSGSDPLPPPQHREGQTDPAALDHYPFFFIPSVISKVVHCVTPHENALKGAIRHLGYRVTRSHTKPGSIKTDAPWEVIWEIMREWIKQKAPVKEGAVKPGMAGWTILGMDKSDGDAVGSGDRDVGKQKIVFDEELGKERDKKKLVRYQRNPRENWGPMNRAKGH